jgi:hypothetical protein
MVQPNQHGVLKKLSKKLKFIDKAWAAALAAKG